MIKADQPTIFPETVIAAVSSTADGSMKFEWGEKQEIITNAQSFLSGSEISIDQTVNLFISGRSNWHMIRLVTATERGEGMTEPQGRQQCDALITDKKAVGLFLPTADCYPAILHDPVHEVLALAHMGWQSTEANLIAKVIDKMCSFWGTEASDILAYFGPGIAASSYRFESLDQSEQPEWRPYLMTGSDGKTVIDLLGYNLNQLAQSGVKASNIQCANVDTATNDNYFSHFGSNHMNKPGPQGRFATVAMMRSDQ